MISTQSLRRAAQGPRSRRLGVALRLTGAAVLAASVATGAFEEREQHLFGGASPLALLLSLAVVLLAWSGLTLLVGGRELFRPQPAPPRSWLPERRRHRS